LGSVVKVFIADDSEAVCQRLIDIFTELPGIEIVGQARDAAEENFGCRHEEVVGTSIETLYANPKKALAIHKTTIEPPSPLPFQTRNPIKEGEPHEQA